MTESITGLDLHTIRQLPIKKITDLSDLTKHETIHVTGIPAHVVLSSKVRVFEGSGNTETCLAAGLGEKIPGSNFSRELILATMYFTEYESEKWATMCATDLITSQIEEFAVTMGGCYVPLHRILAVEYVSILMGDNNPVREYYRGKLI